MAAAPPPANPPPVNPITLLAQGNTHRYGGLARPSPPQIPPTTNDIIEARLLSTRAGKNPRGSPEYVSDDALSACTQYKHAVVAQSIGPAGTPAWFQAWNVQSFQPLANDLAAVRADVSTLQGDVAALRGVPADVTALRADVTALRANVTVLRADVTTLNDNATTLTVRDSRACNSEHTLGDNGPFCEVPFPDGRRPWALVVHVPNTGNIILPRLDTVAAIQGLTMPESYAYFAGHYPTLAVITGPNTLNRQKAKIASAIGRNI